MYKFLSEYEYHQVCVSGKTRFLVVRCKIKAQSYNLLLPIPPDAYLIDISNLFELLNEVKSPQIALVLPFCIVVVVVVCVFF